jgi:hypothetical protein
MNGLSWETIQNVIVAIDFLFISANEVTRINNIFWISIHLNVVQDWKLIPLLCCVEKVNV